MALKVFVENASHASRLAASRGSPKVSPTWFAIMLTMGKIAPCLIYLSRTPGRLTTSRKLENC